VRPPGPPGRCQAVLVSPTAAPVYSTARPARTAPPLCCGTAAACGLGLRPLALGASGGDPPAPGLFLTAQRRRFAPRPDRTRPLAGGAVRDDTADGVSGRGLPENSQRGGLDPNNWQAGFRPAGSGLGGDKGSTCQEWIVQYKPITGPKFTWSVTPAAANSKGLVVGNAERFPAAPTAWKPGGRSQRDRLLVDPEGGAAVPRSGIHRAIHGVSMPEQSDRNQATRSNCGPCSARGFWNPGDAPQDSHNTPLRDRAALKNKAYFVIRRNTFLN